jgi:hypothetical protein
MCRSGSDEFLLLQGIPDEDLAQDAIDHIIGCLQNLMS